MIRRKLSYWTYKYLLLRSLVYHNSGKNESLMNQSIISIFKYKDKNLACREKITIANEPNANTDVDYHFLAKK